MVNHGQKKQAVVKSMNSRFYLHSAIMLSIMFGFGYIPPTEPLTVVGMKILGVFLGMLYGWSFVDLIWPSLLGMIALGLSGYSSMVAVFKGGFGDDIFVMLLFTLIYSAYLNRSGFNQYIAQWFVSRKMAVGRPWIFSLMIFLTSYILGSALSMTAAIIITWNIFYGICDTVGYKKGDKYPVYALVGIVVTTMLGYALFPFKPVQALLLAGIENICGATVDFFLYTAIMFVITGIALMGYLALGKFIFRPDVSLLSTDKDHFQALRGQKMNPNQKIAAISFAAFLMMVLGPSILPNFALMNLFKTLRITGSIILVLVILMFIKMKDGKSILDFNNAANDKMGWDVLILIAATMPTAGALAAPEAGIMDMLTHLLDPIFRDISPLLFGIIFVFFGALLTQIAHNLVLAALIPPIMCQFALPLGIDPATLGILVAFSLSVAIATPGASTPGALTYANREWITAKQAYGYSAVAFLMTTLVVIGIGMPLLSFFM